MKRRRYASSPYGDIKSEARSHTGYWRSAFAAGKFKRQYPNELSKIFSTFSRRSSDRLGLAIMGLAWRGDGGFRRRDVDLTALH